LSYAEQRALEIGMTIAGGASMILLDEPTAGMSHSETEYAVALIRRVTQRKTLVMVEHDMRVVFDSPTRSPCWSMARSWRPVRRRRSAPIAPCRKPI
jgi:ABC-type branched-subunit amino acid transport system ATPase component